MEELSLSMRKTGLHAIISQISVSISDLLVPMERSLAGHEISLQCHVPIFIFFDKLTFLGSHFNLGKFHWQRPIQRYLTYTNRTVNKKDTGCLFSIFLFLARPNLLSPSLERHTRREMRAQLENKFMIFWHHSGVSKLIRARVMSTTDRHGRTILPYDHLHKALD